MPQAATHYQPAPIVAEPKPPAPAAQDGLSFAFSQSEDKATGSYFNKARATGTLRLTSTLMNSWGDIVQQNRCNTIGNMLGLWGNATYFLFGNNKNPVLGQLTIEHGQWNLNGDYYEQVIPQAIPKESLERIAHMIGDDAHPKKAMMAKVDGKNGTTKVCIRSDLFEQVQSEMKASIARRNEAFKVMAEPERQIYSNDKTGNIAMSGFILKDVSDDIVREIHDITRNEWQIRSRVAGEDNASRHLEVHPVQLAEFEERVNKICNGCQEKMVVKRDSRAAHAPGFFNIMFQPHKYPVEHSILMGGLGNNVMRLAGVLEMAVRKDLPKKEFRTKEFVSNVMNLTTYLIELQPESSRHARGDWEETGDERKFFTRESESWGKDFLDFTDERPMAAGAMLRSVSLGIKLWGQGGEIKKTMDEVAAGNRIMKDGEDITESYQKSQKVRLAASAIDVVTAVVSGTLKKVDFGR